MIGPKYSDMTRLACLLLLLSHSTHVAARGGHGNVSCSGNDCTSTAIMIYWIIGYIAIFFAVLGNRPAKDCPSVFALLAYVAISIALAFLVAGVAISLFKVSLLLAWLAGGFVCFSTFAFSLHLASKHLASKKPSAKKR